MRTCFVYDEDWTPGLHIGAARIAILNWMAAAKTGGSMVLCVNNSKDICYGPRQTHDLLNWLGIDHVHGPFHSSQMRAECDKAIDRLIQNQCAYFDYAFPHEINEEYKNAKPGHLYSRRWAGDSAKVIEQFEKEGRKPVVRLKMPRTVDVRLFPGTKLIHRETVVRKDFFHGNVSHELHKVNDVILQRSDGTYTSYLTNAMFYGLHDVDFVFSDERHVAGVPAILFIMQNLRLRVPQFAHLSFITGPQDDVRFELRNANKHLQDVKFGQLVHSGTQICDEVQENNEICPVYPTYVNFYRDSGFLPEALFHYLLMTALSDQSKISCGLPMSKERLVEYFCLEHVTQGAHRFNPTAILDRQGSYFRDCDFDRKFWLINDYLRQAKVSKASRFDSERQTPPARLAAFVKKYQYKITMAGEILQYVGELIAPPCHDVDGTAADKANFAAEGCPN